MRPGAWVEEPPRRDPPRPDAFAAPGWPPEVFLMTHQRQRSHAATRLPFTLPSLSLPNHPGLQPPTLMCAARRLLSLSAPPLHLPPSVMPSTYGLPPATHPDVRQQMPLIVSPPLRLLVLIPDVRHQRCELIERPAATRQHWGLSQPALQLLHAPSLLHLHLPGPCTAITAKTGSGSKKYQNSQYGSNGADGQPPT